MPKSAAICQFLTLNTMNKKNTYIYYIIFVGFIILSSCSDKYQQFRTNYQFKSEDGKPNYNNLDYWAAHPWKWDPSDSIPKPLRYESRDTSVDVFFLHPTTYTKKRKMKSQNAAIDDDYINAKTDYSTILYQASVFNQHARVFAPRYRQAHITSFFTAEKATAKKAFELAYEDLKIAFEYYLQHWNNGRPIIIASHSQGSMMAEKLLKEYFENKPLKNKLVAAYVIGWPMPENYFSTLKMCKDSLDTGCLCSWRTYRKGYIPNFLKNENEQADDVFGLRKSYVTNPITWTTGNEYGSQKMNKGSVILNFNKVYKNTTDAKASNGLLYVKKPKFPWSFLYFTKNYHVADINLFYISIRENVQQRIDTYWKR